MKQLNLLTLHDKEETVTRLILDEPVTHLTEVDWENSVGVAGLKGAVAGRFYNDRYQYKYSRIENGIMTQQQLFLVPNTAEVKEYARNILYMNTTA